MSHIWASLVFPYTGLHYFVTYMDFLLFVKILTFTTIGRYLSFSYLSRYWPHYSWHIFELLLYARIMSFTTLVIYLGFSCLSIYWPSLLLSRVWASLLCRDVNLHFSWQMFGLILYFGILAFPTRWPYLGFATLITSTISFMIQLYKTLLLPLWAFIRTSCK